MTFYSSLYLKLKVNSPAVIYQRLPPLDIHEKGSPTAVRDAWGHPPALHARLPVSTGSGICLAGEAAVTVALGDGGSLRAETKT